MRRLLLTVGRKQCPFGCAYCFTDFSQYERPLTVEDVEREPRHLHGVDVLYPACDVDLFALKSWPQILERAVALGPSISLSTKAELDHTAVARLRKAVDLMSSRGRLLKVGVSISTQSRCEELEPHAPAYIQRLQTLNRLSSAGIPTALVLRPLLVDISPSEYESIIEDAAPSISHVLTGPEHLDDNPTHSRHSAQAPHPPPEKRAVHWAVNAPLWTGRTAPVQERAVRLAAAQRGLRVFETDLDLMQDLMRRWPAACDLANSG